MMVLTTPSRSASAMCSWEGGRFERFLTGGRSPRSFLSFGFLTFIRVRPSERRGNSAQTRRLVEKPQLAARHDEFLDFAHLHRRDRRRLDLAEHLGVFRLSVDASIDEPFGPEEFGLLHPDPEDFEIIG